MVGHLASVYRGKVLESSVKSKQQGTEGRVLESSEACEYDGGLGIYSLYAIGTDNPTNKSYNVEVSING